MNRFISALPLLLVFVLLAHVCYAPPLPPVPSEGASFDGFVAVLIAAGVFYGAYSVRKKRKPKPTV